MIRELILWLIYILIGSTVAFCICWINNLYLEMTIKRKLEENDLAIQLLAKTFLEQKLKSIEKKSKLTGDD